MFNTTKLGRRRKADKIRCIGDLKMKQKITVIISSVALALFLISGGFSAWTDRLQIGISMTTASAIEAAKDAISQEPSTAPGEPSTAPQQPSTEPQEPSTAPGEPSAAPGGPNSAPEEPN